MNRRRSWNKCASWRVTTNIFSAIKPSYFILVAHRKWQSLHHQVYNHVWVHGDKIKVIWTDELHWFNVPERVQYKLALTVHWCLQNKAPRYLVDCCSPVSDVASRQHLRSASRHFLTIPPFRQNTFGHRAFSVGSPMAWNSLPDSLRDPPHCSSSFRHNLKTVRFARY